MIVSVIMSVYNTKIDYLSDSIESILNQTFKDFEFIIINDNSNTAVTEYLNSIRDKRVRIFHNEVNVGLTKNLNYGVKQANGKYIARMDADDISHLNRLKKQVLFLEKNLDVGLIGTRGFRFGDMNRPFNVPLAHEDIKAGLITGNTIGHPTVMGRKEMFEKFPYNENFRTSQDYELWSRIVWDTKVVNIPERLFKYRVHNEQISFEKKAMQDDAANTVKFNLLSKISEDFTLNDAKIITKLRSNNALSEDDFLEYIQLSQRILEKNKNMGLYSNESLSRVLSKSLDQAIYLNNKHSNSNIKIQKSKYHKTNIYTILTKLSSFRRL
ncbi:glycosyltransferase family 2 protein [Aerococcus urinaeequi]|uniref:glycosyltransferase family 2 protein n=1 Tax=Aerococcus urinaeequi TaxID=51665 RepID=UPI003D6A63F9